MMWDAVWDGKLEPKLINYLSVSLLSSSGVMSPWQFKISPAGSIYTTGMSKHYKSRLYLFESQFSSTPLVKLLFPSKPFITKGEKCPANHEGDLFLLIVNLESTKAKDPKEKLQRRIWIAIPHWLWTFLVMGKGYPGIHRVHLKSN